jgi:hypothetical protein
MEGMVVDGLLEKQKAKRQEPGDPCLQNYLINPLFASPINPSCCKSHHSGFVSIQTPSSRIIKIIKISDKLIKKGGI